MEFQKIESPNMMDLFVQEMEAKIFSGELKPGDRLPTERAIAEQMDISLAVVNGGIKKLAGYGLLRIAPRKGVFVVDYVREGNIHALEALFDYPGNYYNPDIIVPLVMFRRVEEELVLRDSCRNHKDNTIEALRRIENQFAAASSSEEAASIAYDYLRAMSLGSGNVVYPLILANFKKFFTKSYEAMIRTEGREIYYTLFSSITEAIEQRDEEKAVALFDEYIRSWLRMYKNHYARGGSGLYPIEEQSGDDPS